MKWKDNAIVDGDFAIIENQPRRTDDQNDEGHAKPLFKGTPILSPSIST
jgi:hypothetical protein